METKTHVYLYTNIQVALFITGKREKQARGPPTHEWIKVTCLYNGLRGMKGSKCGYMLQHGWNWKASCWIKGARQTRPHEHSCMQKSQTASLQRKNFHVQLLELGELGRKWEVNTNRGFFFSFATLVKMVAQLCQHVEVSGHSEHVNSILCDSTNKADPEDL